MEFAGQSKEHHVDLLDKITLRSIFWGHCLVLIYFIQTHYHLFRLYSIESLHEGD